LQFQDGRLAVSARRPSPLIRGAIEEIQARGFIAFHDTTGKYPKVAWTDAGGHTHTLSMPRNTVFGSTAKQMMARLKRALDTERAP
jgi:hypothetical protein